jgi:hypothetical protein
MMCTTVDRVDKERVSAAQECTHTVHLVHMYSTCVRTHTPIPYIRGGHSTASTQHVCSPVFNPQCTACARMLAHGRIYMGLSDYMWTIRVLNRPLVSRWAGRLTLDMSTSHVQLYMTNDVLLSTRFVSVREMDGMVKLARQPIKSMCACVGRLIPHSTVNNSSACTLHNTHFSASITPHACM